MRFGATRQGPLAPDACQFGNQDVFTRTGVPVRSTSKLMRSSLILILVTVATGVGMRGGVALAPLTRGQLDGPDMASSTGQRDGSWYQGTTVLIHPCDVVGTPCITAGRYAIPLTGALSATR